ncbi:amidohydrolase [Paenarthrobacter sp. NPDC089322]|uniref:amidohydrolase n=1 Tax=Paenarthrobacter sp. NPDC089322 TaxID=3155065 RepID=UPI00341A9DB8
MTVIDSVAPSPEEKSVRSSQDSAGNKFDRAERLEVIASITNHHLPVFTELSDAIWDHPQLRWEESDAVERQIALAEQHGFKITRELGGIPTAFSAEYGSGGPVIAVLGEFDALAGLSQASGSASRTPDPGNTTGHGHGCGHHLLGAGSLLAAVTVAEYLRTSGLPGRVRYYGCPAEEAGSGKAYLVKAGAFDDVDAAVTWHPIPNTSTRQWLSLANINPVFHFRGVAAHAGGAPHMGRSALDAVELLNVGVNFLREHMLDSSRIHYAITDAGGESPNVVQSQASVYYLVRARTVREMQELYERVLKVARGAALMTETELTVEIQGATAELLPNEVLERAIHEITELIGPVPFNEADQAVAQKFLTQYPESEITAVRQRFGIDRFDTKALHDLLPALNPSMPRHQETGSTDVGDVSWVTPTVQIFSASMAIGTQAHSWQWVAQGKLPAAHKGMAHAAKVMASTAVELLTDEPLLAAAKAEHLEATTLTPFISPIPDGVLAPPLRTNDA